MKIAVTSAFGWPYIRRGNRVAYELAVYLASRGNEVHFITTKPGSIRRGKAAGNLFIKYYPVIDHPVLTGINIEYWQTFALTCLRDLLNEDYDLVYTCLTMDACAANLHKTVRGTPYIPILITGDPLYRDARWARRLFRRAVEKASRLVTISHFVNEVLKRDFGLEGVIIPCPVDTSKFYYTGKKENDFPRILCTATLLMERKRVPLLVKAFEILIKSIPDAVLQLAGESSPEVTRNLLKSVNSKTRKSIQMVDISSDDVLASFYRNATITVLPSLNEAFGMVTTESLASGTPVVGTRSGGTVEILDDPRVGVLFEPTDGPEELCKALIEGIELAKDPETSRQCNEHAQRYSWNTLGPKYEKLQEEIFSEISRGTRPRKKTESNKSLTLSIPNHSLLAGGQADKQVLNKLFVDTLDSLEITSSAYYHIEGMKPGTLHFLDWIINKAKPHNSVLVLSPAPQFLALLLNNLGIRAKQIVTFQGSRDEVKESFDIIVCDDLIQHWPLPVMGLQELKRRLNPGGTLLMITQNVTRGASRFRLLAGRNIYPWFGDIMLNGAFPAKEDATGFYREYTLKEVNELASKAGFELIEKQYITGKKHINKTVNFASTTIRASLLHTIYHKIQRLVPALRSHVFVAAINSLPKETS